ncbi:MAG TPA: DUF917 domain-containing protein [Conexibacter sp.]|jgi:hypothetical protein
MEEIRTATDVEDFLRGANFMSASGGGDPVVERAQLMADLEAGRSIGWTPLEQFADDDVLFCVCYSGAIAPEVFEDKSERAAALGGSVQHDHPFLPAVQLLERQLGVRCAGLISVEIGGINSGAILSAAARLGLPLANADYAGRAIAELHSTTLEMFGAPVLPFACADQFGNETLVVGGASNAWTERISKHIAQAALGIVACAFAALPAARVKEIAIAGTMAESLALGRAIREADGDPVQAAADALDGWVLFRGTVSERTWENNGYMEGRHTIAGTGDSAGHALEVWFRNENHVTWLDGEPWVASPDLIEFCDAVTAEPLVNTNLAVGQQIAVVGRRRRDAFDSDAGLAVLGPKHFGFDLPFRGIEALVPA